MPDLERERETHRLINRLVFSWNCESFLITEIGEFEFASLIDEQILRLEITMKYLLAVTIRETAQELKQKQLDVLDAHDVVAVVHVLFEVFFLYLKLNTKITVWVNSILCDFYFYFFIYQIFEYKRERLFGVDNVVESDNVGVLELPQQ